VYYLPHPTWLGCEGLPGTNGIIYLVHSQIEKKKVFLNLTSVSQTISNHMCSGVWEEGFGLYNTFPFFLQKQNKLECFSIASRIRLANVEDKRIIFV